MNNRRLEGVKRQIQSASPMEGAMFRRSVNGASWPVRDHV